MKQSYRIQKILISIILLLLLITEAKSVVNSVSEGLQLCIQVIIPSLFPFFVITTYLNQMLMGISVPGIQTLCRTLSIPQGGDSLLILGLIGGYPVGAQLIGDCYHRKQLTRHTAEILLGYCSNAGPAFIFGVAGSLFGSIKTPLILWLIHMLSALITGYLLPRPMQKKIVMNAQSNITVVESIQQSIIICTSVCAWILLFKAALSLPEKLFSQQVMTFLYGFLELSNGCIQLKDISCAADKFILCSVFLSFGGLCVMLQTSSVTKELGLGLYIPGKIIQTAISMILSVLTSTVLFPESAFGFSMLCNCIIPCFPILFLTMKYAEKRYGNPNSNRV